MHLDILNLLFRWTHILAASIAIGATVFMRLALVPSAAALPPAERALLANGLRARWSKVVMAVIGLLLLSGLVNLFIYTLPLLRGTRAYGPYNMLFGIKFLLALAVFAISSLLSGRSATSERVRARPKLWLNVNLALLVAIVCLSGILRMSHNAPTP